MYYNGDHFIYILSEIGCGSRTLRDYIKNNLGPRQVKQIKWTRELLQEAVNLRNPNVEIIGPYVNYTTKIHCRCRVDGYEWNPLPGNLLRGDGCPVCGNEIVVRGINDIWTTDPEIGEMLDNPEDGYKYCVYTNKRLKMHCLRCGNKQIISPNEVKSRGFCCKHCSVGISYPERFFRNLLKQLNVGYKTEYSPDWIKPRRYDFYIYDLNIIIETNGL